MDHIKHLTSEIFAEYQDKPVPVESWFVKTINSDSQILLVPDRGLLLYYTREHTYHGKCDKRAYTHIWLCGVKRECRRQGVLRSMFRSMLNDPKCKKTISVHLNRKKFPEMIAVLEKLGFRWVEDIVKKNLERFEIDADLLRKKLSP